MPTPKPASNVARSNRNDKPCLNRDSKVDLMQKK